MVFDDDAPVAEALRADLGADDAERRLAAVERAGREGGARCAESLAQALGDAEPRVRAAAARSLALLAERAHEHGDPPLDALAAAAPALRAAARDAVPEVRRGALEALALLSSADSRATFEGGLADPNPGVRIEAVRGLWRLGGTDSAAAIAPRLEDEDHLVRYYALLAVAELDPLGAADALAARLSDRRAEVAAEAAFLLAERRDRRALPVLCRTLAHRDLGFEAARLLGELGDPSAVPTLRAYVRRWWGTDPLVRLQAAASLGQLGDPSGEPLLLRSLRSWRKPVRGFAMEILSELRAASAFEAILRVAGDPRDYHCGTAARALGRYRDARAVDFLCRLLETHPDPDVREDAARALGEIGDGRAREVLRRASDDDPSDAVREAARAAREAAA